MAISHSTYTALSPELDTDTAYIVNVDDHCFETELPPYNNLVSALKAIASLRRTYDMLQKWQYDYEAREQVIELIDGSSLTFCQYRWLSTQDDIIVTLSKHPRLADIPF